MKIISSINLLRNRQSEDSHQDVNDPSDAVAFCDMICSAVWCDEAMCEMVCDVICDGICNAICDGIDTYVEAPNTKSYICDGFVEKC